MTRIRQQIEESVGKGGPPVKDEPSSSSGVGKSFIRAGAAPGSNRSSNSIVVPPSTQSQTRCGIKNRGDTLCLMLYINTISPTYCARIVCVCLVYASPNLSVPVPPLRTPSHLTRTPRTCHPSMCRHRAQRILPAPAPQCLQRSMQPITPWTIPIPIPLHLHLHLSLKNRTDNLQRRAKSLLKTTMWGQQMLPLLTPTHCPWWWRSMITRWCDVTWCDYWYSYSQYFPASPCSYAMTCSLSLSSKRYFHWLAYKTYNDHRPMLTMSSTSSLATMLRWGRIDQFVYSYFFFFFACIWILRELIDSIHHVIGAWGRRRWMVERKM